VALFRATSAHRISAFRAFPSRSAATPLDARYSLAVLASSGVARVAPSSAVAPAGEHSDATVRSPKTRAELARAAPPVNPSISPSPAHRSELESRERLEPPTGYTRRRAQRCFRNGVRPFGASSGRREPTTSERCSDRESVLDRDPLGPRPSRCSLDLSPLRGLPIQSLDFRPPLMCLLGLEPLRPKTRCLMASRHFRVSIRPDLGATPKTDSNLLGVSHLFRSPRPSCNRRRTAACPSEQTRASAGLLGEPRVVTRCEEPRLTEVSLDPAPRVT
jgi:hypothetical protein